ncbi:hypothetical protein LT679_03135 [Mucilaginibacter roseus]|uniref:DUF4359 domain-containing protein n=1 Tax=Mucilaginibacter roseus TaxID=1528868 RepID=A0ABS8TXI8_9SPHI|nr:hypothetical protein [Mucilaginibacter roseus]MCD8739585.1 hypothetical protein [Mucilaginibacter roseus]
MNNDYHQLKKAKGKTARLGVWVIIGLIIVFGLILVRFTQSGSQKQNLFGGMPSKEDAYEVAKTIVEPSIKGDNISFSDEGFEFGKRSDSIYVIRSYADVTTEDGSESRQYFNVTLKYNGGLATKANNWELQALQLQ